MKEEYLGDYEELYLKMKILLNLGFKCSTVKFKVIYIVMFLCLKIHSLEKDRIEGKNTILRSLTQILMLTNKRFESVYYSKL